MFVATGKPTQGARAGEGEGKDRGGWTGGCCCCLNDGLVQKKNHHGFERQRTCEPNLEAIALAKAQRSRPSNRKRGMPRRAERGWCSVGLTLSEPSMTSSGHTACPGQTSQCEEEAKSSPTAVKGVAYMLVDTAVCTGHGCQSPAESVGTRCKPWEVFLLWYGCIKSIYGCISNLQGY